MKRSAFWAIVGAGLVAWLVIIARSFSATPHTVILPQIAAGPSPTPFDAQLVKLVNQDCGLVNAVLGPNGRVFVDYSVRPQSIAQTTEYVNGALVPRKSPFPVTTGAVPDATLPGPKQGSVSQVVTGNALLTFYTGRADGDPTGPFFLWVLIEPIPAPP